MSAHILQVKNMVCPRCVLAVQAILAKAGIPYHQILYGELHLKDPLSEEKRQPLEKALNDIGFELIDSRAGILIEKIKQLVTARARNGENGQGQKLSALLSAQLHHEYTYLSSLFSSVEGRTIEHYYISQRIERAKELLIYGELTLSQIAHELGYSSTAHLSSQFRKVTGLTSTHFRDIGAVRRKSVDGA